MDVQTESTDPLPCESQSSGKIRKGFKLFGKRKPGNIFTIRSKGDGNNKSPVNKSKSLDGISETGEPDLVQEPDRDRGQEVSQGEMEQREEEALGEGGIQALAHSRNSVSSTSSARSLKFLSLLRGGRRGTGDRRVHTVSQPVGRQRRGLKGLFGTIRLKSKDKEEAPPSPLLKSSRANSVEIIKEDLTLTPKVQPRSLDSPETENTKSVKSLSSQDSTPSTPSEAVDSRVTADNVSTANEHVPPLPTSQPPLEPGDNSLSNLLADISSLLTFESISGGGDVMANVEAEWGKANATSKPTSPVYKPSMPTTLTSMTARNASVAKAPSVDVPMTVPTQTVAPPAQTASSTATAAAPGSIITTTKASTLATSSDTLSSGFAANLSSSTSIIKTSPTLTARKLSSTHVTAESVSSTSSSPLLTKSTLSSASMTTTTVPPKSSAAPVKCPSVSPAVTFTVSMLPSETVVSPQLVPLVVKPSQVTTPPPELPPVTHSPPSPVAFDQPSSDKLDSVTTPKLQTSTTLSLSSAGGESTEPVAATTVCTISTFSFEPLVSKTATFSSSTATDSASVSKPTLTSAEMDSNQTPTSLATLPQVCPPILSSTFKTQPSPSPVSAPPTATLTEIPARTKENTQLSLDEVAPAAIIIETPTSTDPTPNQTSQFKSTFGQGQTADFVAKDPPAQTLTSDAEERPAQIETVQSKLSFDVDQITSEAPPAQKRNEDILISLSKVSPAADSESAITPTPLPASVPSPVSSLSSPSWPSEAPSKIVGSRGVSSDGQVTSLTSKEPPRAQSVPSKNDEQHNESQISLQGTPKEGKTQHPKPAGLSKIPVVGGGRVGKLPVRESQHVDTEAAREPPTPETEKEKPHFNSHDAGSKDKSFDASPVGLTSKRTQEKSQQLPQPKVLTSSPRDSKIPMKHSPQPTASQIPVARDTPRTKIPVSRVPVRRAVNKPAVAYGSSQIRK